VFCAVESKAGPNFTFATPDRSAFEFARVVFELAMRYPDARTIHLVTDNLNIHRRKSLTDTFGEEVGREVWDRFTVHYTPRHGSWLNQAEIEIGMLSRQCLGKRRIPDLETLRWHVAAWNRRMNRAATESIAGSTEKPLAANSATKRNTSNGHRTREFPTDQTGLSVQWGLEALLCAHLSRGIGNIVRTGYATQTRECSV
jgi:hypothetical protein